MQNVAQMADLIQSHCKFFLKEDPVDKIYLDKSNNVIVVLYEDLSNHDLTRLRTKYIRALTDNNVNVSVYNRTNVWRHDKDTGVLYSRWNGFYPRLNPYTRVSEYGSF